MPNRVRGEPDTRWNGKYVCLLGLQRFRGWFDVPILFGTKSIDGQDWKGAAGSIVFVVVASVS